MSKYIDAEKLTTIIEERKAQQDQWINRYHDPINQGISHELTEILSIVDSLQQEPRFPQYDNIIEKVFGAGNLEGWEFREAEMLVALAKEELLKSLQQEQPDKSFCEENCKGYKDTGGKCFFGFNCSAKKAQEQPEVDLEKFTEKIETFQGRYKHPESISIKGAMAFMSRMFYQYPNVARKWYEQLSKATMD